MTDNTHATDASTERDTSGPLRFAFYGRCATEDNQDPDTSRNWQRSEAQRLLSVSAPNADIASDYFDAGQSKTLAWADRPEASRLLNDLTNPDRGWEAVVVGEGRRCFYGTQFSDLATLVGHHGVDLYVPELEGRYDPDSTTHHTLMTIATGMSAGDR